MLLAADLWDYAYPIQGNPSEKQGREWIETNKTSNKQCHYIATVHAFAQDAAALLSFDVMR